MKYTATIKSYYERLSPLAQETRIFTFTEDRNFKDVFDVYNNILDVLDIFSMLSTPNAQEISAFYVDVSNYVYPNEIPRKNIKSQKHFMKQVNGRIVEFDIDIQD